MAELVAELVAAATELVSPANPEVLGAVRVLPGRPLAPPMFSFGIGVVPLPARAALAAATGAAPKLKGTALGVVVVAARGALGTLEDGEPVLAAAPVDAAGLVLSLSLGGVAAAVVGVVLVDGCADAAAARLPKALIAVVVGVSVVDGDATGWANRRVTADGAAEAPVPLVSGAVGAAAGGDQSGFAGDVLGAVGDWVAAAATTGAGALGGA